VERIGWAYYKVRAPASSEGHFHTNKDLEYRQAHPSNTGPDFQESSPGLNLFVCLVNIGEHPEPFGNQGVTFARKKDAKQYSAKLAIEWLIANHHMPSDGSVSFPKSRPQQPPAAPEADPGAVLISVDDGPSYGQRVAEMCGKLAMSPPVYMITQHEEFKAMYSGYATFESNPQIVGRVGEFSNIYGRKRAKEACAEKVLEFLESIAAIRAGVGVAGAKVPDAERVSSLLD
jgi:hypothetical protein